MSFRLFITRSSLGRHGVVSLSKTFHPSCLVLDNPRKPFQNDRKIDDQDVKPQTKQIQNKSMEKAMVPCYPVSTQLRLRSDRTDVQANLSLCLTYYIPYYWLYTRCSSLLGSLSNSQAVVPQSILTYGILLWKNNFSLSLIQEELVVS